MTWYPAKYISVLRKPVGKELLINLAPTIEKLKLKYSYYGGNISLYFVYHTLHIMYDVYNLCTVSEFVLMS